ncbi:hypothetical protein [Pseudomonas lini]
MTAQQLVLPHALLQEAVGDELYVSKLKGDAHAVIPPYENARVGDVVVCRVETSTGNEWHDTYVLTEALFPLVFVVPKAVFEKNLVPKATAKLGYSVRRTGKPEEQSPIALIHLKQ